MIQNQVFFRRSSIAIIVQHNFNEICTIAMVQVGQPKNIEGCLNTFTSYLTCSQIWLIFFPWMITILATLKKFKLSQEPIYTSASWVFVLFVCPWEICSSFGHWLLQIDFLAVIDQEERCKLSQLCCLIRQT